MPLLSASCVLAHTLTHSLHHLYQVDDGDFPLGSCNSYAPRGCDDGYDSGDIFYLEVCVYDAICANRDSLWTLNAGDPWHCDMDYDGYKVLFNSIL